MEGGLFHLRNSAGEGLMSVLSIIYTLVLPYHNLYFQYLGCVEVFESRGMQVCEEAVKTLKDVSFVFATFFRDEDWILIKVFISYLNLGETIMLSNMSLYHWQEANKKNIIKV